MFLGLLTCKHCWSRTRTRTQSLRGTWLSPQMQEVGAARLSTSSDEHEGHLKAAAAYVVLHVPWRRASLSGTSGAMQLDFWVPSLQRAVSADSFNVVLPRLA